jgi:RNA-directed DNA polymerase
VSRTMAAHTVASTHGPWRIANSPAMSYAFPNAYFDSLGVPRLFPGP